MWEEKLRLYDAALAKCPRFKRKGTAIPFTSANGYQFSQLNKDGELGILFSDDVQDDYFQKFNTTLFKCYGTIKRGYVLIPESVCNDEDQLVNLLNESYDYVMTLEPK